MLQMLELWQDKGVVREEATSLSTYKGLNTFVLTTVLVIPISQMMKLRPRDFQSFAQGYTHRLEG